MDDLLSRYTASLSCFDKAITYAEVLKEPYSFLSSLLDLFGLSSIADIKIFVEKLEYCRCAHIVNVFLSGTILFSELYRNRMPEKGEACEGLLNEWNVLSLAHDIGYIYETFDFAQTHKSINAVCQEFKVRNFFPQRSCEYLLSSETYARYFRYKRKAFGLCDHGIIGALLFNHRYDQPGVIQSKADLSWIIAAHSIFISKPESDSLYRSYGLQELMPGAKEYARLPYRFTRYGLTYILLCLIDITEPINAFRCACGEDALVFLRRLSYTVHGNCLSIRSSAPCDIDFICARIHDIDVWMKTNLVRKSMMELVIEIL